MSSLRGRLKRDPDQSVRAIGVVKSYRVAYTIEVPGNAGEKPRLFEVQDPQLDGMPLSPETQVNVTLHTWYEGGIAFVQSEFHFAGEQDGTDGSSMAIKGREL